MRRLVIPLLFCACLCFLSQLASTAHPAEPSVKKPKPDEIIKMLQEGNRRFQTGNALHPHTDAARLAQAGKENQADHAFATVLACSDSRVPVEFIFDAGIMDLFVIRIAGNVCDTDEIGSIEYGLAHVNTPVLVVLGHTRCGAVTAVTHALQGKAAKLERNIPPLVDNIIPAVKRTMNAHKEVQGDAIVPYAIEENVWQAIDDLLIRSPAVRNRIQTSQAKVVGAIYDIASGSVRWLPQEPVNTILKRIETDPKRTINPYAVE